MKRFLLFLFFFFLFISGIFYTTFHTTIVSQWLIKRLLSKNLPDYKVQTLTIRSQDFHFPRNLKLNDFELILKTKSDRFELNSRQIALDWFKNFVRAPRDVQFVVQDFNLKSANINLKSLELDTEIHFGNGTIQNLSGRMKSADVDLYSLKMTDIATQLEGGVDILKFKNFIAHGYAGQIQGEIVVRYHPDVTFALNMKLDGLDLKKLQQFNQSIFSNLEGELYGNIQIKGNPKELKSLDVNVKVIKEGKVRASMLRFFMSYLPNTQEKVELESLIKNNGKLPFEHATFKLISVDQHNLSGLLEMSSKTINLNLNMPVDIKIDGTWDSLIQWWQNLPK